MYYITDTRSLLWHLIDSPQLGPKARDIFKLCELEEVIIIIPIIVLLEALDIFEKKKIDFNIDILIDKIVHSSNYQVQDLDLTVFDQVQKIKAPLELHDRVIVSTAKLWQAKIITRNSVIQKNFKDIIVW